MSETGNQHTTKVDMMFTFPDTPSSIQGEPTLRDFLALIQYLMDCLQSHEYSPSDLNMLLICLPQQQYAHHTNTAYPVAVGNPADDSGQRAMIWHTFSCQKKWFNDTATMNSSLIDRSLTLLKNTFTEEYKLICMGNCKQSFQVYFQWFLDKHAHNNKIDGTTNKEVMQAQWNPADGFKTLVVQVTK